MFSNDQEELLFYRKLLGQMNGCVYVLNHSPYRVEWITQNNTMLRALGISAAQVIEMGDQLPYWMTRDPDFKESVVTPLREFEKDPNTKWGGVFRLTNVRNEEHWIAYTVAILDHGIPVNNTKYVVSAWLVEDLLSTPQSLTAFSQYLAMANNKDTIRDLTARQKEVLVAIAKGMKVKEIGKELQISNHTVEDHKKSLFRKLNCSSQVELGRIAKRLGLV